MKVQDLGELSGPILAFGGPYSNLQATQALIAAAADHQIAPEGCICTGDIVAYCGDPRASVDAVRRFGCAVVAGNCEQQLAINADDCGCGFEAGTTCDRLSAAWYGYAQGQITDDMRHWMARLPDIATFLLDGLRFAVLHGGASNVSRFIWPSDDDVFRSEINNLRGIVDRVDVVVSGHCGIPFARDVDGVRWINAGVIGMPPHDGRPMTRYAVINGKSPVFHRLNYDHHTAAALMRAKGLNQGYDTALQTGIWPSEDVLPPEMKRG